MENVTVNEFSLFIETLSLKTNKSVLDTIIEYCEENYIDVTEVAPLLNENIVNKLEQIFVQQGAIKKSDSYNIEDLL